jgi:hypothetical protein
MRSSDYYREKAAEARNRAMLAKTLMAQEQFDRIARQYEVLAQQKEQLDEFRERWHPRRFDPPQ